jgi:NAD-dependent dihydropyrimidine dehydrogenase PreA subunit
MFVDKADCSGCGACAAVCSVSAIFMEPDSEGFRYPRIDEARCVQCGQCTDVCPLNREREKGLEEGTVACAFQHSRPGVLQKSASGKDLLIQGIATSIDALSVGFTIAEYKFMMANAACLIIGAVTFVICVGGLLIGRKAGTKLSWKASILGGCILVAIGIEIFYQGVFV